MLTEWASGEKNKSRKITQETIVSYTYGRNKKLFTEMEKKKLSYRSVRDYVQYNSIFI